MIRLATVFSGIGAIEHAKFKTTLLISMTTNSKKEHILILSVSCYMSSYIERMLYDILYHAMNLGTATPYKLLL